MIRKSGTTSPDHAQSNNPRRGAVPGTGRRVYSTVRRTSNNMGLTEAALKNRKA